MSGPASDVPSPCVRQCCLGQDNICLGCFRALDEITGWTAADAGQKRAIVDRASQRRRRYIARQGGDWR